ncbi:MAG: uracil-DNA glycosylase [Alphaproteobacteria bacterium]|nr:uracil-DNA glycosylase [Alphaproteobacteria bacterium]
MSKDALQFYIDNDLAEVISEKPQNHFTQKQPAKETAEYFLRTRPKSRCDESEMVDLQAPQRSVLDICAQRSAVNPPFTAVVDRDWGRVLKPQFSTNQAISTLAQRTVMTEKFQPLNDIVAQARKAAQAAKNIDALREAVKNFDGCNLKKMATNTVFADGNPNSRVMVIGEAPGNHEDLQGVPFCGDSGQLLDEMLRSINLTRQENFYISNVIFWRPPGNRRPTDEELAICRPFVERHIQLINPEILVLVGATAMTALLGIVEPVSKIRGQFMDFSPKFLARTIKTFTIFHPSYLLRQPGKKKVAWQDMLALEEFLK